MPTPHRSREIRTPNTVIGKHPAAQSNSIFHDRQQEPEEERARPAQNDTAPMPTPHRSRKIRTPNTVIGKHPAAQSNSMFHDRQLEPDQPHPAPGEGEAPVKGRLR